MSIKEKTIAAKNKTVSVKNETKSKIITVKNNPIESSKKVGNWIVAFTKDLINHSIEAAVSSAKSLWMNLEAVSILTLAGLGVSHFIGVIAVSHPALSVLLVSEMLSPLIAVILIWGLIRLMQARKKYRVNNINVAVAV